MHAHSLIDLVSMVREAAIAEQLEATSAGS